MGQSIHFIGPSQPKLNRAFSLPTAIKNSSQVRERRESGGGLELATSLCIVPLSMYLFPVLLEKMDRGRGMVFMVIPSSPDVPSLPLL